jgi:NADPH:quinone reductase-like Zn-dependent oxidoreductase
MKAFGFEAHGGLERARVLDLPVPEPGPGEVRLSMTAAGLNHLDLFTLEGLEGVSIPLPHVLAGDGTGRVESNGPGAARFQPGERVLIDPSLSDGTCEYCLRGLECFCRNYRILGEHVEGVASELAVVPERNLVPLPPRLDPVEGAGVALVFMTAYRALSTVGRLSAGDQLAIIGAGGGLSTAAVQLGRERGARVVVASRSAAKLERVRALGADDVLPLGQGEPLDRGLWRLSGKKGFDVIYDCTGRETFALSARALARGGRLVFSGATTGPQVSLDLRPLFWRGVSLCGSTMATRREFAEVLALLAEGKVHPVVDRVYPLAEAPQALAHLSRGEGFGKVLLRV